MKITQISIFLENKEGRIYDVCRLLGEKNINIRALNLADSEQFGILRMVVDKPEAALEVLKKAEFTAKITDIVAVEVPDIPGGLALILKVIHENKLNVEYMYGFVEKSSNQALMVFRFENMDNAVEKLSKNGVKIIGDIKNI